MQGNVLDFERKFFEPKRGQIQKNWRNMGSLGGQLRQNIEISQSVGLCKDGRTFFRSSIVDCFRQRYLCSSHLSCVKMEDQIYLGVMERAPDGRLVFRRVTCILKYS